MSPKYCLMPKFHRVQLQTEAEGALHVKLLYSTRSSNSYQAAS